MPHTMIKVAIIDDGIFADNPYVKNSVAGVGVTYDSNCGLMLDDRSFSEIPWSHGTLCAAIVGNHVPDAILVSVKAIDETRVGHPLAIAAAIDWAVENQISVINLSLGTTSAEYSTDLYASCERAIKAGVHVVAAAHIAGLISYPSAFQGVISVGKDDRYSDYSYGYYPYRLAEFVAGGNDALVSRILNEMSSADISISMSSSTSIAAARITAVIASILMESPTLDVASMKELLISRQTKLRIRDRAIIPSSTYANSKDQNKPSRVAIYRHNPSTGGVPEIVESSGGS